MFIVVALGACTSAPAPARGLAKSAYDVSGLIHAKGKYLGVSLDGVPGSTKPLETFASQVGKKANLVEYFVGWNEDFDMAGARRVFEYGSLPFLNWEPYGKSLDDIAAGLSDYYIWNFATRVRELNLPIMMSFGHEMNGSWFPWGAQANSAASFVRAWRRIHDTFHQVGATNVIWTWSPNIVNPVLQITLAPLFPGDDYVDLVGLVGYYRRYDAHTFAGVYQPTIDLVRAFTRKPLMIAETGVEPGPGRPEQIADLLRGVVGRSDVIGFVYFDRSKQGKGEADWRIAADAESLAAFRGGVGSPVYGGLVR
ncbi:MULTISPECIES: glycoside hydrolase family 26 protein [unclassified Frankia]|uniref:glycoside hydrolase family 26 protein n=1 Tax=unclassified Frankia TaxID=2632575 RepID=UPI002AD49547|nr:MULTISPECIES: glycosyl hydrolase [unclassified Frankia]